MSSEVHFGLKDNIKKQKGSSE